MDPDPHGDGCAPYSGAVARARWKALPVRHGYTNSTERVPGGVRKSYAGPDALARAHAELTALTRLAHLMPVPAVVERHADGSIVTEFRSGEHGQDLIEEGHAHEVLASCGALLRRLHALDPGEVVPGRHPPTHVVLHGDFGPNNILFGSKDYTVTALLDWEFCTVGPAIGDIAWCEWIVRMHHPADKQSLTALFDAYGERPSWEARRLAMIDRCRRFEAFGHRWDAHGELELQWRRRIDETAAWTE
jgi:aminoglycoside phosphotransferase (APT) family kinase protein